MKGESRTLWGVFRWPVLLASLSSAGLLAALIGDGTWDAVSWLALAIPVVIGLRGLLQGSRRA